MTVKTTHHPRPEGLRLLRAFLPAVLLAALAPAVPAAAQSGPPRCATPEHRAFDFWAGEWDVFTPDGRQAGTNVISVVMGGCVLHERYQGGSGYHGESFNVYDASRGVWHQSWVDTGGLLLLLEGGLRNGAMVLEGVTVDPEGEEILNRITWTPLDEDGSRVRQHWERSADGGQQWSTVFDGEYRRR